MLRKFLSIYRRFQYFIFRRHHFGVMGKGEKCIILDHDKTTNMGDVVHPCVRYIPEGFRGHRWWMVYTPYYAANSKLENPILCWGDSKDDNAPKIWKVEAKVVGQPSEGYNSDPYLMYDEGNLKVYWRECETKRALSNNMHYVTYVKEYTETTDYNIENPILYDSRKDYDRGVSPAFINFKGKYLCFSMNLRFKVKKFSSKSQLVNKLISKILLLSDLLGIYSQQKSYGISLWSSNEANSTFNYQETIKLINCNRLYRPWHLDIFSHHDKIYAVIQSNQSNADIILAESNDGREFKVFKKPLITNETIKMLGIYKPTCVVVNNVLHLYYTAQDPKNRKLNQLFVTSMEFNKLIKAIK